MPNDVDCCEIGGAGRERLVEIVGLEEEVHFDGGKIGYGIVKVDCSETIGTNCFRYRL
jgi:hypothetical protein